MRAFFLLFFMGCVVLPLAAGDLRDEFNSIDKTKWVVLGRCSVGSGRGVYFGPQEEVFGINGLQAIVPVGNPQKKIKITVEFSNLKVEKEAPREGTNEKVPSDITLNVGLWGDKNTFYQTSRPAVIMVLMYNRELNVLYGAMQAKPGGAPLNYGQNLSSITLGPAKDVKVKEIFEITGGYSVTATFFLNGTAVWAWSGSVPDRLDDQAYLSVYQQNVLSGSGSVMLDRISVESSE